MAEKQAKQTGERVIQGRERKAPDESMTPQDVVNEPIEVPVGGAAELVGEGDAFIQVEQDGGATDINPSGEESKPSRRFGRSEGSQ